MSIFHVTGLLSSGTSGSSETHIDVVEASSSEEAMQLASRPGFLPLKAERRILSGLLSASLPLNVSIFTQELLSLLEAGLTLNEALETLDAKETQPRIKHTLQHICGNLREGHAFSEALKENSSLFDDIYVATVKASERTGDMVPALRRYLAYRRQLDSLQRKIISAAIYPVILVMAGLGVTLFMLLYLVPRFSLIYGDIAHRQLPLTSRILIEWGQLLHAHTETVLLSGAILLGAVIWLLAQSEWRARASRMVWRIRGIGRWLRLLHLSRFYRAISMLLQSGVPLLTALSMAESMLHPALREGIRPALNAIEEGQPLSVALKQNGLLTAVAERLVGAGEKSGNLAEMLERTSDFHDEETSLWVERFSSVFEPLLMLLIGLFVGLIVVLMYLPIFDMAGSWQQP